MEVTTRFLPVCFMKAEEAVNLLTEKVREVAEAVEFDVSGEVDGVLTAIQDPLTTALYAAVLEKVVVTAGNVGLEIVVEYYKDQEDVELDVSCFECAPKKPEKIEIQVVCVRGASTTIAGVDKLVEVSTPRVHVKVMQEGAEHTEGDELTVGDELQSTKEETNNGNPGEGKS
ncbi:MAG TPA: hypothetical protein VNN18_03550 [Candidatus Xenobia bacterium]|nr:hypothetical protein [Candidatus Xenobia bacterium]